MLDDNSVGNTRNTVTFIKAYFGKKRSCWYKKDPLPFSGYNLRKDVGGKDYSRTACLLYTFRAHETGRNLVCRLLLEKKKKRKKKKKKKKIFF